MQLNDLSLPRRIQLAVVAHIRHIYTDYDSLLHSLGWAGARANVASKTLEVLASWRGDKDDDIDVVEDILREVIVISDDEDDSEVVRPQNMKVITSDPPNLSSISLDTRTGLFDQGKSDRIGARRQIWLDARERRKKPVSMPQARDIHSYYVPRPGRDAPMSVDQKLYEQRLKGLKDHTEDSVPTVQQAQMSSSRSIYDQVR